MNQPAKPILSFWQRWVTPHPSVQELGQRRRVSLLAGISLFLTVFTIAAIILGSLMRGDAAVTYTTEVLAVGFLLSYIFVRTRYHLIGAALLILIFLAFAVYRAVVSPTQLADIFYSSLPFMFVISIAFFTQRGMWMLFGTTMAGLALVFLLRETETRLFVQYFGITGSLGLLAVIVVRFRDGIEHERIEQLQTVNQQLTEIKSELEQRVEERTADMNVRARELERRTRQMDAVAKVARVIASIQELDRLLPTITQVVSEQFDFYHTGIFLLDEQSGYAVLQAASSEGGQNMLKRGHRLRLGTTGIVGYVAAQGEARIALDVGLDAVYFNNPDLPNTRSEMGLPLKVGGRTIGVLDVQSTATGAFKTEDISVLTTLANQVAIAIENARLFDQTRRALAESQTVYEEYSRQEWARFARRIERPGYAYDGIRTVPLGASTEEANPAALKVPVKIRGLVVGHVTVKANDPLRQWTQDELVLAQAAAERAGLAIENVRLLDEAQRRAAKERAIGEISSRISASIDLNSIMQTAVEEIGRAIPGSEIILQFQQEGNKEAS